MLRAPLAKSRGDCGRSIGVCLRPLCTFARVVRARASPVQPRAHPSRPVLLSGKKAAGKRAGRRGALSQSITNAYGGACAACGAERTCAACVQTAGCERCTLVARCGSTPQHCTLARTVRRGCARAAERRSRGARRSRVGSRRRRRLPRTAARQGGAELPLVRRPVACWLPPDPSSLGRSAPRRASLTPRPVVRCWPFARTRSV